MSNHRDKIDLIFLAFFGHNIETKGKIRYLENSFTSLDKKLPFYGHFYNFMKNSTFSNENVDCYSLDVFLNQFVPK